MSDPRITPQFHEGFTVQDDPPPVSQTFDCLSSPMYTRHGETRCIRAPQGDTPSLAELREAIRNTI